MDTSILLLPVFIAGLLTFLAPCTLPLVPGYVAFIGGTSLKDLRDGHHANMARRRMVLNGLLFVMGFSLVFITLGALAGLLGTGFGAYRSWLSRVGGVMVIFFGLFLLEVFHLPWLQHVKRLPTPRFVRPGRPGAAFLLGAVFGFGWTPCIGPILGSVLFLVSSTATLIQGIFLLAVFSLGLGIPFVVVSMSIGSIAPFIHKVNTFSRLVSLIGGVFLVFLGLLLLFDSFGWFAVQVYDWFDFVHYDQLLEYL